MGEAMSGASALVAAGMLCTKLLAKAGGEAGMHDKLFSALDKDGDGNISLDEMPQTAVTGHALAYLDTDGDGKISKKEFLAGATVLTAMALAYVKNNGGNLGGTEGLLAGLPPIGPMLTGIFGGGGGGKGGSTAGAARAVNAAEMIAAS